MLDVLGIALAIAMLMLLTWLRAVSAVVVPRLRYSLVPAMEAPKPFADLFEQADAQWRELGFGESFWVVYSADPAEAASTQLARIYRHSSKPVLAGVMAPVELNQPNRPMLSMYTTLDDGSTLTSLAYSAGSAIFSSSRHRRLNAAAADAAALWQAHFLWRYTFAQADAALPDNDAHLVRDHEQHNAQLLEDLVAGGVLRVDRNNALRLRAAATLRAVWQLLRAPKPPPAVAAVREDRQLALLNAYERITARTPSRAMQWVAFVISAALFGMVGAAVWSGEFALILLGVLVLHEGGHFLAMRLLGYRNVQMVLLPLLGGVTTGVERDPNGTHRALVSLAGPLPGIALGWALLWWSMSGQAAALFPGAIALWLPVSLTLLSLNYLNLLPIPPLDGGHFLQSLVPRGWAGIGVVLIGALGAVGLALAFWLQSVLLGIVVAAQLIGLRRLWRDAQLAKTLHGQFAQAGTSGRARDAQILARVSAQEPRSALLHRYARLVKLRTLIDLRPPRGAASVILVALYLAPFAMPWFLLPSSSWLWQMGWPRHAAAAPQEDPAAAYRKAAAALSLAQLVDGIAATDAQDGGILGDQPAADTKPEAFVTPTDEDFAAAETRLGGVLPEDYRELAKLPNRKAIGLRGPAELKPASAALGPYLQALGEDGSIHVDDAESSDPSPLTLPTALVAGMTALSGDTESGEAVLLLDVQNKAALDCCHVLQLTDGSAVSYPSLTAWLRRSYANAQVFADFARKQQQRVAAALDESRDWTVTQLLDGLARMDSSMSLFSRFDLKAPAAADIAEVERRLGSLPPEYREVLARQNGVPSAMLLPVTAISLLDEKSDDAKAFLAAAFLRRDATGKVLETYAAGTALQGNRAIVIGAVPWQTLPGLPSRTPMVVAVEGAQGWRYLDLPQHRVYASLRELLQQRYARLRSVRLGD